MQNHADGDGQRGMLFRQFSRSGIGGLLKLGRSGAHTGQECAHGDGQNVELLYRSRTISFACGDGPVLTAPPCPRRDRGGSVLQVRPPHSPKTKGRRPSGVLWRPPNAGWRNAAELCRATSEG